MDILPIKASEANNLSRLAKCVILGIPYYSDFAKRECLRDFQVKKIRKDLRDRNNLLVAAREDGKFVGFMRGFFDGGISSGIFWLQWVGVDPEHRRGDVAGKMLDYIEGKVKKSYGCHKIVCVIRPGNKPSLSLFAKKNYRRLALLKRHWYGEDFLLYYKFV